MSKKRKSHDEQTNEDSDSVFQQDANAKRAKLTSYDTTLQDLPVELIQCILIKAVAMEVKGMKMAKIVWKEKADPVISRLGTVCSQWWNILTTDFFRNELHRTLDRTAQKAIRMEILHQFPLQLSVIRITTIKDEIFILSIPKNEDYHVIHVYDRNNMAEVKDVIQLGGIWVDGIAACNVSNCVYILNSTHIFDNSILRITKDDRRQFNISPLISDLWMPNPNLLVTANGSLVLLRRQRSQQHLVISMYNANGSLQHEIKLSSEFSAFRGIIPRSNGNLVLVSYNDQWQTKLMEIDMDGTLLRQYQSSLCAFSAVCHADIYGRMFLTDPSNRMELLDSELNLLDFTGLQLGEGQSINLYRLHYNSGRNEVVTIVDDSLTIFHFTEE